MTISRNLGLHFGYKKPTDLQKRAARDIIDRTPTGPTPYDIARSFISRTPSIDAHAISQWPKGDAWNPLIVEFFSSTTTKVSNDMTAWCAAFVNWCFERNKREGTDSASSQSFLTSGHFKQVNVPIVGDLAIFTCYDRDTGNSLGLGHVGFVNQLPVDGEVDILGGNQSVKGVHTISVKGFETGDVPIVRKIDGRDVKCTMRLNRYLRPVP